jgi:hypothetical protein
VVCGRVPALSSNPIPPKKKKGFYSITEWDLPQKGWLIYKNQLIRRELLQPDKVHLWVASN